MYIQVDIKTETLLESLLENIEETENTKQVLEITKWLIKEVGCYGAKTKSEDIKQVRRLLINFGGILELEDKRGVITIKDND